MGLVQTAESAHHEMEGPAAIKVVDLRAGTKVRPKTFSISSLPFSFFLYADYVDKDGQGA